MASRRLVSASVRDNLLGIASDIGSLERNYVLPDEDLALTATRRRPYNRLGLALPCHEIFVWTMDFPRGMLVPCHSPRSAAHCGTRRRLRV